MIRSCSLRKLVLAVALIAAVICLLLVRVHGSASDKSLPTSTSSAPIPQTVEERLASLDSRLTSQESLFQTTCQTFQVAAEQFRTLSTSITIMLALAGVLIPLLGLGVVKAWIEASIAKTANEAIKAHVRNEVPTILKEELESLRQARDEVLRTRDELQRSVQDALKEFYDSLERK